MKTDHFASKEVGIFGSIVQTGRSSGIITRPSHDTEMVNAFLDFLRPSLEAFILDRLKARMALRDAIEEQTKR